MKVSWPSVLPSCPWVIGVIGWDSCCKVLPSISATTFTMQLGICIGILCNEAREEDEEGDRKVCQLRKNHGIAVVVPNDDATNHKLPASAIGAVMTYQRCMSRGQQH